MLVFLFKVKIDFLLIELFSYNTFQGDGAGKDVLTGLSNGMDRHKSKDKVFLILSDDPLHSLKF